LNVVTAPPSSNVGLFLKKKRAAIGRPRCLNACSASLAAAALLGPQPTLGRGALELTRFTWLHVVPATTQILKDAGALNLLLEDTQGRFDSVAFAELNLYHFQPTPIKEQEGASP
jgi:hypothetical protein